MTISTPFPSDEHGTTPTPVDWARANGSLDRHVAAASKSPRFESTRREIEERQATLSELRRAFRLSQVTLAETLSMSQSELSRLERRSDLLLSTLSRFVAATGGHLSLVANYPDRAPIELRIAALAGHHDNATPTTPSSSGGSEKKRPQSKRSSA